MRPDPLNLCILGLGLRDDALELLLERWCTRRGVGDLDPYYNDDDKLIIELHARVSPDLASDLVRALEAGLPGVTVDLRARGG